MEQQQRLAGEQGSSGWKGELDGIVQLPGIERMSRIEQGDGGTGDVQEFDEFIAGIVVGAEVRGVIMDLADEALNNSIQSGFAVPEVTEP